jgi:hypothetical protein
LKARLRHHKSASPSSIPSSPIATISSRPTGNHDSSSAPDTAVTVIVLAAGLTTVYIIYRRKKKPR